MVKRWASFEILRDYSRFMPEGDEREECGSEEGEEEREWLRDIVWDG